VAVLIKHFEADNEPASNSTATPIQSHIRNDVIANCEHLISVAPSNQTREVIGDALLPIAPLNPLRINPLFRPAM